MAAASPPPPPPPPAPTTIAALSDDILREIFLRLPDITTLARAVFARRAFLRAVRSSPAFRRRFRELRAPPLLAFFGMGDMRAVVPAAAGKGSDIAAAIAAAIADLLQNSFVSKWRINTELPYIDGYVDFFNGATGQEARYSPHSQSLNIYPKPKNLHYRTLLEFHTLSPDGKEQQPSRVVCVHRDDAWAWARVAIFSSHTMDWQVLPEMEMDTGRLLSVRDTATVVGGFVCWVGKGCILALNTRTFQFSRMDLPPPLKVPFPMFRLGQTKDGELFLVGVLKSVKCTLYVWLWAANDDDGVGGFMLHKMYSLQANVSKVAECPDEADVRPIAVINGFVYLCVADFSRPSSPSWSLSFCLETAELNLLHKDWSTDLSLDDPYIMVSWPSSLIRGKEDSETRVARNMSKDDGLVGTKEASPVLFSALQSFKEILIHDGNINFIDIDSFLLNHEMNSLLNRITNFESGLAAARDRVLRIHDNMEGWQMCKAMLGRACSGLFTRRSWSRCLPCHKMGFC